MIIGKTSCKIIKAGQELYLSTSNAILQEFRLQVNTLPKTSILIIFCCVLKIPLMHFFSDLKVTFNH